MRTDLHLSRTMLTGALARLRGSFRLRLASTCNHSPKNPNNLKAIIIYVAEKHNKYFTGLA